jgi:hypothetical protein
MDAFRDMLIAGLPSMRPDLPLPENQLDTDQVRECPCLLRSFPCSCCQ